MTSMGSRSDAGVFRPADDDRSDLGFGAVVSRESRIRLLNRDGTFNVERRGLHWFESLSAYHALLTMSWPQFFSLLAVWYVVANALFALGYVACGPAALVAPDVEWPPAGFWRAFFFSVQTLATIGYGHIHPAGLAANALVTIESLIGLLGFALFTGLLFARSPAPARASSSPSMRSSLRIAAAAP
jgi:inward rectifier potassium channel